METVRGYQKQLVEMAEIELRRIDDIAHVRGDKEALDRLHEKFIVERYAFNRYGEIREIELIYRERISHTHKIIYDFASDSLSFNFYSSPDLYEIRLDYSEEFMFALYAEFVLQC